MCIVFVVFVLGIGVTAGYGFWLGGPTKLIIGWDSMGNGCGYNETTKDYPMLYFPATPSNDALVSLETGNFTKLLDVFNAGVCVSACPTNNIVDPVLCKPTDNMNKDWHYKNC